MTRYPSISDHGLIGDLQTAALVTTDGTVDWFCCPRFDSPSVFASLLDADKGGHFRIAPDREDFVSRQLYLPGTAILITRFMTPDGVGEVRDFMPVITGKATERQRADRGAAGDHVDGLPAEIRVDGRHDLPPDAFVELVEQPHAVLGRACLRCHRLAQPGGLRVAAAAVRLVRLHRHRP